MCNESEPIPLLHTDSPNQHFILRKRCILSSHLPVTNDVSEMYIAKMWPLALLAKSSCHFICMLECSFVSLHWSYIIIFLCTLNDVFVRYSFSSSLFIVSRGKRQQFFFRISIPFTYNPIGVLSFSWKRNQAHLLISITSEIPKTSLCSGEKSWRVRF